MELVFKFVTWCKQGKIQSLEKIFNSEKNLLKTEYAGWMGLYKCRL